MRLKNAKKEHLIKLFIDDHGSSVDEKKEADLHGHFFPENYYLQLFSEQFIDFINSNGKNIDPDLNEWRYEKYTKIAYRFEGLGSYIHKNQERNIYKILLSKGITHYYDLRKSGNKDDFEKLWATQIAPYLWEINKNIASDVEIFNDKKLKKELLNTIKEQHQRALRIISKKLTKEPEKVKKLIESYR